MINLPKEYQDKSIKTQESNLDTQYLLLNTPKNAQAKSK